MATVALPVAEPKHSTLVEVLAVAASTTGSVMVTVSVAVHRLASVTVIVYGDPEAASAVIVLPETVPPVLVKVYGAVPPVALITILPSLLAGQVSLLWLTNTAFNTVGWVMVIVWIAVQPLVSVTVTMYVPAIRSDRKSVGVGKE